MYKYSNKDQVSVTNKVNGYSNITPGHWMWQEYQEWLAEGNVTEPFETEADIQEAVLNKRKATNCGALQIRKALRQLGLLNEIKTLLKTAPEEVVEACEYATVFRRMDEFVLMIQKTMGKTDEEVDAIFELANTFE